MKICVVLALVFASAVHGGPPPDDNPADGECYTACIFLRAYIASLQVATTCDLQTALKMRYSYCLELELSLLLLLVGTCVE